MTYQVRVNFENLELAEDFYQAIEEPENPTWVSSSLISVDSWQERYTITSSLLRDDDQDIMQRLYTAFHQIQEVFSKVVDFDQCIMGYEIFKALFILESSNQADTFWFSCRGRTIFNKPFMVDFTRPLVLIPTTTAEGVLEFLPDVFSELPNQAT